jgi:hypothetical protein
MNMATVSFAVGSVSVAVVWGTFFYPPPAPRPHAAPAVVTEHPAPAVVPATPTRVILPAQKPPALALSGQTLAVAKP